MPGLTLQPFLDGCPFPQVRRTGEALFTASRRDLFGAPGPDRVPTAQSAFGTLLDRNLVSARLELDRPPASGQISLFVPALSRGGSQEASETRPADALADLGFLLHPAQG